MPKCMPQADELDESYGGGSAVKPPAKPDSIGEAGDETPEKTDSVDKENAEEADLLIDKKKLPADAKEGDVCSFRIVKDYGDEVSLQYVKEGEETKPGATDNMSTEDHEIAALDTKE